MKKTIIFFLFFLILSIIFNTKKTLADHNCFESCGKPSYCNSGLQCISGICKNPNCPNIRNCACPSYKIKGYKVKMPGNVNIAPFSQQTVTIGSSSTQNQPYEFINLSGNNTVSVSVPLGSTVGYTLCFNNTDCHTNPPTSGSSVTISSSDVITGNIDQDNYYYADLWWHYTPLTPNCKNLKINGLNPPVNVLLGDTITLSATYENANGPVTSVGMVANPEGTCSFTPLNITQNVGAGNYSFSWTPSATGNYDVFCRAWNNEIAECRGKCVDGPPSYQCDGSNGNGATSYGTVSVTNPSPWYKLKDTSLNKLGNHNISVVTNPQPFDNIDDNTNRYVIINSPSSDPGIILASGSYNPGPSYNPIQASIKNWYLGSYIQLNNQIEINFYEYIKSRKQTKEIENIANINSNGIYIIKSDNLTINNQPNNYDFLLVVRNSNNNDYGNLNININNFNSNLNSIAIVAKNIVFNSTVNNANGIFIALNQFTYQSPTGLKIKGNLISKNQVSLVNRNDTNQKPSLFIVFDKNQYMKLLPILSIMNYQWQEIQ